MKGIKSELISRCIFLGVGSQERWLSQTRADAQLPEQEEESLDAGAHCWEGRHWCWWSRWPPPRGHCVVFTTTWQRVALPGKELIPQGLRRAISFKKESPCPDQALSDNPHKSGYLELKGPFAIVASSYVLIDKPREMPLSNWATEYFSETTDCGWWLLGNNLTFISKQIYLYKQLHFCHKTSGFGIISKHYTIEIQWELYEDGEKKTLW